MKSTRFSSWSRKNIASATAIAVIIAVPTTAAVLHQGFPVTDVDLVSRDVWVTNSAEALAGRLNRQIEELTAAVPAATSNLDVLQDGNDVFLFDSAFGSLERVDPANVALSERVDIKVGSEVAFGGDNIAVVDPATGEVWLVDASTQLSLDVLADEPVLDLGAGGKVAVSSKGTIFATDVEQNILYTIEDFGMTPTETELENFGEHQLSVVGETPVILDISNDRVITGDNTVIALPAAGIRLQQTGAENDFALVATGDSLLQVPLGGGVPVEIPNGTDAELSNPEEVSAPVWLDGYSHGAWAGSQQYLLVDAAGKATETQIPKATAGSKLEFRVNRNVIALNNMTNGDVWLVDANMRLVDNWDEVTPPEQEETEEGDEKSSQQSFEDTLAERTDVNRPPIAQPDEYGFRAGVGTILPVLDNDTDPDGDVLMITQFDEIPETAGVLSYIDGGRALQFTPTTTQRGGISFSYTVSDGRGGTASATVSLNYRGPEVNVAPVSNRTAAVSVEAGQSISYNVLSDWRDPDGDDIYLASVVAGGDTATFTPDGYVTFQHRSGGTGLREVQFTVSDGTLSASGILTVDVKDPGTLNPVGTPDFVEVFAGETASVKPLENDLSPSGQPLVLLGIDEPQENLLVTVNQASGEIIVQSGQADSYYIIYQLGAGAKSSIGIIRVEVKENPENLLPPVAVKDIAYMRAGEAATVPVLANDSSPGNRVLVVQSVDTGDLGDLVNVEVLGHQRLRVSSSQALTEQVQFTYTVGDGAGVATASVTVIPLPAIVKSQPPIAVADAVNVRAGDIVSVDVLDNDYHPDGMVFELEETLVDVANAGEGSVVFVGAGKVRYQAPMEAGVYSVNYRITDVAENGAVGTVTFTVVAEDEDNNQAPLPLPIEGRVFSGATTEIQVPLDGIDPNGDSVVLLGISRAPASGTVDYTSTTLTYTARSNVEGTDTFSYRVRDRYGLTAEGTVRIGIIQPPDENKPPRAQDDRVEVQPEKLVSIPVLANDSDPNGFTLQLDEITEVDPALENRIEIEGTRIIVEAPETPGGYLFRYQMSNGRGGTDLAWVTVIVSPDARIERPTAEDVVLEPEDTIGQESVTVDVSDSISNPNGRVGDLAITVDGVNARNASVDEDGIITVTPTKWRQAVTYRVTDEVNELSAEAFIIVPEAASEEDTFLAPYLRRDLGEQIVDMNGERSWELEDILVVPSGGKAIITDPGTLKVSAGSAQTSYVDNDTIRLVPPTDFRGQVTMTFEVTDGADAADETGRKALITFPITVGNPDFLDTPPTFTPTDHGIEAGEAPLQVDLRGSSDHPNPNILARLQYTNLQGATGDIQVSQSGSVLTISAERGVQPGATATITFTVGFDDFEVPGSITVSTVPSTRPPAQPASITVPKLKRGTTTAAIDVLDGAFNPFAAGGEPLNLIDASIRNDESGNGATLTFSEQSDTIQVTGGPGTVGRIEVVYTLRDATLDPSRDVQGSFIVTVHDVPDTVAPAPVRVSEGDGQITVRWTEPGANGEPITNYRVRLNWAGNSQTYYTNGPQTELTVGNLANGTPYTAVVWAENLVGWATNPSAPSPAITPYGAPTEPGNVRVTSSNAGGNVRMTVNFNASNGNGRDISRYHVQLLQGGSVVAENANVTGTTASFDITPSAAFTSSGGKTYTARVIAWNAGNRESVPGNSVQNGTASVVAPGVSHSGTGGIGSRQVTFTLSNPNNGVGTISYSGCASGSTGGGNVNCTSASGSQSVTLNANIVVGSYTGPGNSASATTPSDTPPQSINIVLGGNAPIGHYVRINVVGITGTHQMCVTQSTSPNGPWSSFSADYGDCDNVTVTDGYAQSLKYMGWYSSPRYVRVTYAGFTDVENFAQLPGQ